jgi:hypothetical protein
VRGSFRASTSAAQQALTTTVEQTVSFLVARKTRTGVLPPRASAPPDETHRVWGKSRGCGWAGATRADLSRGVARDAVAFEVATDAGSYPALGLPRVVLPCSDRACPDRRRRVETTLPDQRCHGRALRDACPLVAGHAERLRPMAAFAPCDPRLGGHGVHVEPVTGVQRARPRSTVMAIGA